MPVHTYPSWVVHIPKMGTVASTCWTQYMPQKLFTDRRTDGQSESSMPHRGHKNAQEYYKHIGMLHKTIGEKKLHTCENRVFSHE